MEIYFAFLPTRKKEEENPTYIAHIAKASRANAQTKTDKRAAFVTNTLKE